jgi:hypothetical protein
MRRKRARTGEFPPPAYPELGEWVCVTLIPAAIAEGVSI